MKAELKLQNRLKEARCEKGLSQSQLAELVGVSRNTISSIETGQFNPTAKLALILCIALDRKFEDLFQPNLERRGERGGEGTVDVGDGIVGDRRDLLRVGLLVRERRFITGDVHDLADDEAGLGIHRNEFALEDER